MSLRLCLFLMTFFLFNLIWQANVCDARYLPTRSTEDRATRVKELIQEFIRSEKNGFPLKDQYDFISPEDYSALINDGYSQSYDNRDIDSRITNLRRFLRQQQIAKA